MHWGEGLIQFVKSSLAASGLFFFPLQRLVLQGDQVKRMANLSGEVMAECESERGPKHKHQPACATGEGHSADTLDKCSLEPRLR